MGPNTHMWFHQVDRLAVLNDRLSIYSIVVIDSLKLVLIIDALMKWLIGEIMSDARAWS
jgi:hypothetical protein